MARKRTKAKTEAADTTPVSEPAAAAQPATTTVKPTEPEPEPPTPRADQQRTHASDPRSTITVSLSDYKGGPKVHLLRSQKFNQMQICFDGAQPDERFLAMLAQAGWKDRTEAEGVWTKQIDREARWQSVQQMEREFRTVANAIRASKQLAPALALAE
jgi:hypothetical protein